MINLIDPSRSRAAVDALESLAQELRRKLWDLPDDSPQRPGAATAFALVEHHRLTAIARDNDVRTLWNTLHTKGVHALDPPPPPGGINISLSAGEAHALDDVVHLLRDIHSLAGAAAGIDAALALAEERHANRWKHHRLMCAVRDRRQAILGH